MEKSLYLKRKVCHKHPKLQVTEQWYKINMLITKHSVWLQAIKDK